MKMTEVFAVIGGWDYEGESFNSLRVFSNIKDAIAYKKTLHQEGYDIVEIDTRTIDSTD